LKEKMKGLKWFAFLILSISIVLAGCSKGSSTNSSDTVTIRVGTWEGGDAFNMQQQIADNYEKDHKNVKIKIESVPDQYGTKLLTQIAAGEAPDIFQVGDGDVAMFMAKGAFEELNPYIEGDNGINLDDYYEGVLKVGEVDGKLYTLPKDYSDLAIYYNKDLFDKAGVKYPEAGWTWEDLYEVGKKLTVKDGDKIVQWGIKLPGPWDRAILPLIHSYGGNVISPDGKKFDGFMNSDGTVKAMEMYKDMYFKDTITPSNSDSEAFKGVDLFNTGRVAMNLTGKWPAEDYKSNPNLNFGVVELPEGPTGPANTICYAGYGLYSNSKNKEAAWDYLKYLTGEPGQKILAKHAFTAVKSVAEDMGYSTDPVYKPFMDGVEDIKMFPRSPYYATTGATTFGQFLEKLMLNQVDDIGAALDEAAKEADKLMDEEVK
jgi:multiple sugar transport system substrate-binding protein